MSAILKNEGNQKQANDNKDIALAEQIELEEKGFREENLEMLKQFLNKARSESITIEWNGIHFYPEMEWHFTRDLSQIIIQDEFEDMILGTTDIIIENIASVGYQLFCMDNDVLIVELYNNDTISISID